MIVEGLKRSSCRVLAAAEHLHQAVGVWLYHQSVLYFCHQTFAWKRLILSIFQAKPLKTEQLSLSVGVCSGTCTAACLLLSLLQHSTALFCTVFQGFFAGVFWPACL